MFTEAGSAFENAKPIKKTIRMGKRNITSMENFFCMNKCIFL